MVGYSARSAPVRDEPRGRELDRIGEPAAQVALRVPAVRRVIGEGGRPFLVPAALVQEFVLPRVELGGAGDLVLVPHRFELALEANELGTVALPVFVEPVGEGQAGSVVVQIRHDPGEERISFVHRSGSEGCLR
jgi:hypothetical protein